MSQKPYSQRSARPVRPWRIAGLALAAIGAAALAGCGQDNAAPANPSASNSAPSASTTAANASVASANVAAAPTAPACPKLAAPRCPAASTPAVKPAATHMAAIWSNGSRRGWSHRRARHHLHVYAAQRGYRGLTEGDRLTSERDGLMGGPAAGLHEGYRIQEESRESERSAFSRSYGGGRVFETYREDDRRGPRPCPTACRGGWNGDWRGGYRVSGMDASGYLVWPGKVEY